MSTLSQGQIVERLIELEQSLPICDLALGDMELWPIIRHKTYQQTRRKPTYTGNRPPPKTDSFQLPPALATGDVPAIPTRQAQLQGLGGDRPLDLMMLSRAELHTERVKGGLFDRLGDSVLLTAIAEGLAVAKLEVLFQQPPPGGLPRRHIEPALSLPNGPFAQVPLPADLALNGPTAPVEAVQQALGVTLNIQEIGQLAVMIWQIAESWKPVLAKAKPRAVILQCYYYPAGFGLTYACNQLGIPVVELQHGQQGQTHLMYTNWPVQPPGGFKLRPSHFWVWGKPTAGHMRWPSAPDDQQPQIVVGGNPWMSLWRAGAKAAATAPVQQVAAKVADAKGRGGSCILLALQPSGTPIAEHVLQVMKAQPGAFWLVRLHPHQFGWRDQAVRLLTNAGISNFDIDNSSEIPLFEALRHSDFILTQYSSVTREAIALGKPAIVTDPMADDVYRADLDGVTIQRGYDEPSLAAAIQRLSVSSDQVIEDSEDSGASAFIEADPALVTSALATCLNGSLG